MSAKGNISEQLSAYLDGELDPAEVQRVERALEADPALRIELAELAAVRNLLRGLAPQRAPEDLTSRVLAEAERSVLVGPAHTERPPGALRWVRYLATAAVLLVAAGVGMVIAVTLWSPPRASYESTVASRRDVSCPPGGVVGKPGGAELRRRAEEALALKSPRNGEDLDAARARRGGGVAAGKGDAFGGEARPDSAAAGTMLVKDVRDVALALAGENNEIIFTDQMDSTQRQIEKVLLSNGIVPAVAVDKPQELAAKKEAERLSRANVYNQSRLAADRVQYELYVTPEQMAKVQEELGNLRAQQKVSQEIAQAPALNEAVAGALQGGRAARDAYKAGDTGLERGKVGPAPADRKSGTVGADFREEKSEAAKEAWAQALSSAPKPTPVTPPAPAVTEPPAPGERPAIAVAPRMAPEEGRKSENDVLLASLEKAKAAKANETPPADDLKHSRDRAAAEEVRAATAPPAPKGEPKSRLGFEDQARAAKEGGAATAPALAPHDGPAVQAKQPGGLGTGTEAGAQPASKPGPERTAQTPTQLDVAREPTQSQSELPQQLAMRRPGEKDDERQRSRPEGRPARSGKMHEDQAGKTEEEAERVGQKGRDLGSGAATGGAQASATARAPAVQATPSPERPATPAVPPAPEAPSVQVEIVNGKREPGDTEQAYRAVVHDAATSRSDTRPATTDEQRLLDEPTSRAAVSMVPRTAAPATSPTMAATGRARAKEGILTEAAQAGAPAAVQAIAAGQGRAAGQGGAGGAPALRGAAQQQATQVAAGPAMPGQQAYGYFGRNLEAASQEAVARVQRLLITVTYRPTGQAAEATMELRAKQQAAEQTTPAAREGRQK